MNLSALIGSIGSIGPFASRIFLPALVSALLLRFGAHLPLIDHLGLIRHAAQDPTWFTSNPSILILLVLTVLETLGQKNPESRRVLNEIDIYLKPIAAALCSLGVLGATDGNAVGLLGNKTAAMAGLGAGQMIPPFLAAVGTFALARVRRDVVRLALDHVDGTGLDHLLSWGEDGLVAFAAIAWLLFPLLMLLLIGLGAWMLARWRRRLHKAEEQHRIACEKCRASIFPCAVACPACRTPVPEPRAVGFLGNSKPQADPDPAHHPYRLVEKKRCALCATHLRRAGIGASCAACGSATLRDAQFAGEYANYIARRLPKVLAVSAAIGLIPLLGLILGSIYYRTELVLPLSEYLPAGRRFSLRIGLKILFVLLAVFQLIPVAGAAVLPIMALISYSAYRASFLSHIAKLHAGEPLAAGPAIPAV